MHIDIEGQPGSGVTFIYSILNFAHIARHARNSKQSRLPIQHFIDFLTLKLTLAHQVSQDSGIHGTGARPIIRPSSGVKPIVVSTLSPSEIGAREQPLPRWQVTSLSDFKSRRNHRAARSAQYW